MDTTLAYLENLNIVTPRYDCVVSKPLSGGGFLCLKEAGE